MDSIKALALEIGSLIDDKKGEDIILLDLKGISSVADYFVIASGNSDRHVSSIIDNIEKCLAKKGTLPRAKEGHRQGRWVILDYHDVLVHVFHREERQYYNLERVWNDAKNIKLSIDRL